jgi:outer membrane biosynthesis protein TonB
MAVQPPAHYAPHQAVAAAPMMGAPMMAPSPLGAPYGVAPAPYARKQKSNAGLIAGVLAGGGLVIVAVLAVAVFLVRSRSDEPVDSSQLIELPPVTTVAPIDTPAPYETAAPPEIPTATAEAPPVKTTPTATAKPPATTKPPPTATTTSKPPPTATATATTTSKPPPTATATATTTTPTPTTTSTTPTKPPGGRPPAIRKK